MRHRRPADALGVAALLDDPGQVGGDERPQGHPDGRVDQDGHLVGVGAGQQGGVGHGPIQASARGPRATGLRPPGGRPDVGRFAGAAPAHYPGAVTRTDPAAAASAVPATTEPAAPAVDGPLLPDADDADAHRPKDSSGVPVTTAPTRWVRRTEGSTSPMSGVLLNILLILLFIVVGGVFAAAELALVSLRDSQVKQLAHPRQKGPARGQAHGEPQPLPVRGPDRRHALGFLSAAFGAATLADDLSPVLQPLGLARGLADTVALVLITVAISYASIVLGELAAKRLALQRAESVALMWRRSWTGSPGSPGR